MNKQDNLGIRREAIAILEQELGRSINDECGFGEWIDAKDKAVQRISVFIAMNEEEPDMKEFWKKVEKEILYNI